MIKRLQFSVLIAASILMFCQVIFGAPNKDEYKQNPYTGKPDNIGPLASLENDGRITKLEKKKLNRTILLSEYGVTGTGDETIKVQAAFDAITDGTNLVFDTDFETKSIVYFPTTAKTFKISGNGKVWKNYSSSALLTSPPFAVYSSLSIPLTAGVDSFTIPGGVSFSIGDFLWLQSDTPWLDGGGANKYYDGSVSRVYEIAGGKAYLDIAPYRNYTANTLSVYHGYENVEIEGITFDQSGQTGDNLNKTLMLVGVTGADIHDNEFSGADYMLYGTNIVGNNINIYRNLSEGYLDLNGTRVGYCLTFGGSNIKVDNNVTINCKHNIESGNRGFTGNNLSVTNNYMYQDPAYSGQLDNHGMPYFWAIADMHANVDRVDWSNNTMLGVADGTIALLNIRNGRTIANDNIIKQLAGDSTRVIVNGEAPTEYIKMDGGEITMLAASDLLSDMTQYDKLQITNVKTTNVNLSPSLIQPKGVFGDRPTLDQAFPLQAASDSSVAILGERSSSSPVSSIAIPAGIAVGNYNTADNNGVAFSFASQDTSSNTYSPMQFGVKMTSHTAGAITNEFRLNLAHGAFNSNTNIMTALSSGEVGIGTLTPESGTKLDVNGTAKVTTLKFGDDTTMNTSATLKKVYDDGVLRLDGGTGINFIGDGVSVAANISNADVTITGTGVADVLLLGRSGGQVIAGGTAASENLALTSTSHATKNRIYIGGTSSTAASAYDEINGRLGVGTTSPATTLHAKNDATQAFRSERSSSSANVTTTSITAYNPDTAANNSAGINFVSVDSGAAAYSGAFLTSQFTSHTSGSHTTDLVFGTTNRTVSSTPAERLRIAADGRVTYSNSGGHMMGSMSLDNPVTITVSAANTWYEIDSGATDFVSGKLTGGVTLTDHYLTVPVAQTCFVVVGASLRSAVAAQEAAIGLMVNGTIEPKCHGHATSINATQHFHAGCSTTVSVPANGQLSIATLNHDAANNITINHADLSFNCTAAP